MAKLDSINYKGTLQEIVPEIAPLFKTTEAYSAGDHVIYEAQWYTFKADKAAGAWDATKVDGPFTVSEDITQLKSEFTALESDGVVPSAEQILTDKGVTDSVPYHYHKTGGDGADRLYDQIVGGTVNWNQLIKNGNFESASNWDSTRAEIAVSDNVATITANSTDAEHYVEQLFTTIAGHIYCVLAKIKTDGSQWTFRTYYNGVSATKSNNYSGTTWLDTGFVINNTVSATNNRVRLVSDVENSVANVTNVRVFDLTAMFGPTIADYIYSLDQATAGAGVAFFKALFPNDYYPYNAGELVSVSGLSAHKMVGFNQWDEVAETGGISDSTGENAEIANTIRSKNYIPALPQTTYYIKCDSTVIIFGYDGNKSPVKRLRYNNGNATFVTSDDSIRYIRFCAVSYGTTYNHDICINISDPAQNGKYEPYKSHSYALDSTLTLRGLFKLDANNKLYADGDVYEYTGKVTRNTILRAYQSGDESLANAITDGTNTVVYSANASTEQADPYQHLQQCDPSGTEEYVSTGIVPVGHETRYPENLRAKIEGLPWNFASLIAPTESTFTATRNYTSGALLIVNNILYKATANIANGGTITPNTNVTATTLAEVIAAL